MSNLKKDSLKTCITSATVVFLFFKLSAQSYTSYFTGSNLDVVSNSKGGICLMGGASEDDEAMKWFLDRANGGDILVLRTTGADGYNNYMFSSLGITVNSVETIVCNTSAASTDPYVIQKINQAEAIWFAGGDQWDYVSFWRNTPLNVAIQEAINQRNIAVGGTSAGMAIQGEYYFSAQNGTVTSSTALNNPYSASVTVDGVPFITNSSLGETITDTHFDNPDRKGRLTTFLARIYTDFGVKAKALLVMNILPCASEQMELPKFTVVTLRMTTMLISFKRIATSVILYLRLVCKIQH